MIQESFPVVKRTEEYQPGSIMDRGMVIYDRLVKPTVESSNTGRLVAIDIDSEQFEIGDSSIEATQKLFARQPESWVAVIRIGGGPVHRIGFIPKKPNS